jgi:hypothetical protein
MFNTEFFTGFKPNEIRTIHKALVNLKKYCYATSQEINEDPDLANVDFDFPDYGGLPEKISGKLTTDQVDAIQDLIQWVDPEKVTLEMTAYALASGWTS